MDDAEDGWEVGGAEELDYWVVGWGEGCWDAGMMLWIMRL